MLKKSKHTANAKKHIFGRTHELEEQICAAPSSDVKPSLRTGGEAERDSSRAWEGDVGAESLTQAAVSKRRFVFSPVGLQHLTLHLQLLGFLWFQSYHFIF